VPMSLETLAGNYVVLDIGGNRFAFYGHLQTGSIRVEPGDRVRRGDVIALVGNSGNSTEPHLHFHVADGAANLSSEGMPYVIDAFEVLAADGGAEPRHNELPIQNAVVRFPEKP
jgi:murein DD-endopeptidase MepM/ murein hydrolase activator NlpD